MVGVASAFAGPSEVVVIAGPGTPPELAAIDLVVQAEHGPDGLAWLVTWSEEVADAVDGRTSTGIVAGLAPPGRPRGHPRRRAATPCWSTGPKQAWPWPTSSPPSTSRSWPTDAASLLPQSPRPAPCSSGPTRRPASATTWPDPTTCCPPTGPPGSPARSGSTTSAGTSTRSRVSEKALEVLGPHVVTLAETEGLPAHAESVRLRWPR